MRSPMSVSLFCYDELVGLSNVLSQLAIGYFVSRATLDSLTLFFAFLVVFFLNVLAFALFRVSWPSMLGSKERYR